MVITTEGVLDVPKENWSDWDLKLPPLNFVQKLQPTAISDHEFNTISDKTCYSHSKFISLFSAHESFGSLPSLGATFALSQVS